MANSKRVRIGPMFFFLLPLLVPIGMRAEATLSPEKATAIVAARYRMKALFRTMGLEYPPERIALLGLKRERLLEIRVQSANVWVKVKSYPILKASGNPGPKLREGDYQVPEGIYRITRLNPESKYYLSLKINFPNEFDLEKAELEKRNEPGSDIYIHGKEESTGCLAMGDPAIEEIYTLAFDTGAENIAVVIAPNDLRSSEPVTSMGGVPPWTGDLYTEIKSSLKHYSETTELH